MAFAFDQDFYDPQSQARHDNVVLLDARSRIAEDEDLDSSVREHEDSISNFASAASVMGWVTIVSIMMGG